MKMIFDAAAYLGDRTLGLSYDDGVTTHLGRAGIGAAQAIAVVVPLHEESVSLHESRTVCSIDVTRCVLRLLTGAEDERTAP